MLKEIHEQPAALRDTLAGRLREDGTVDLSEVGMGDEFLRRLRRIFIVACGTSYHAGLIVSYAIEQLARVPVQIDVASEFRYRQPVFDPDTLVIGITQSGETADTLAAMRLAREAGSPVLALTNIMGSQATRDADYVLFTRAGLEIGVAATKTHTAQVAALLLLALRLAWARGAMAEDELKRARPRAPRRSPSWPSSCSPARAPSSRSPSATTTSASSSTSAAAWASPSASRARSSSRRSATSPRRPTPPAR